MCTPQSTHSYIIFSGKYNLVSEIRAPVYGLIAKNTYIKHTNANFGDVYPKIIENNMNSVDEFISRMTIKFKKIKKKKNLKLKLKIKD